MHEKQKYQIIMQGITSKNVAQTCKEHNISRSIYYKWYRAYKSQGMEGLAKKERSKPNMPNQVDKRTEREILNYVRQFPEDGPKRIFFELQDEGIQVGESGIYNVLRRNGLSRREQRESYAEKCRMKRRFSGDDKRNVFSQKREALSLDGKLDRMQNEKHMRNSKNLKNLRNLNDLKYGHPGYVCQQSITYLGTFPKIGRVYQYAIYDVYSRLGIVKLYSRKAAIHIMDFMQFKIIPLMKTFNFKIEVLVTNQSREFTTNWERGSHMYSDFLHQNGIQQVTYTAGTKEVFEPLHAFLAGLTEEFYEQAWTDDSIESFEMLETRLVQYMRHYNFNRVISDGPHQGKVPADVVLAYTGQQEDMPLWLFTRR